MKNEKVTIKEDVSFDPYEEIANAIVIQLVMTIKKRTSNRCIKAEL